MLHVVAVKLIGNFQTPHAEEYKSNRKLLEPNDNDAFVKEMLQGDEADEEEEDEEEEEGVAKEVIQVGIHLHMSTNIIISRINVVSIYSIDGLLCDLQVSDGEAEILQASQQEAHPAKKVNKTRLNLVENPNFFNIPVNTECSAVHVPSNVFDRCM